MSDTVLNIRLGLFGTKSVGSVTETAESIGWRRKRLVDSTSLLSRFRIRRRRSGNGLKVMLGILRVLERLRRCSNVHVTRLVFLFPQPISIQTRGCLTVRTALWTCRRANFGHIPAMT